MMGVAGNSNYSDERNRLEIGFRMLNPDTVIRRARELAQKEPLTLSDALRIASFLKERGHDDAGSWAARLYARLVLAKPDADLDHADTVLMLVSRLAEEDQQALRRMVRVASS